MPAHVEVDWMVCRMRGVNMKESSRTVIKKGFMMKEGTELVPKRVALGIPWWSSG